MSQDLYELLQAAKADAPPMRRTVEDIIADGRRRQGRRRLAWASGASAVLAAVVAASVAVPQLAASPRQQGAAGLAPITAASVGPSAASVGPPAAAAPSYPDALFAYGFR